MYWLIKLKFRLCLHIIIYSFIFQMISSGHSLNTNWYLFVFRCKEQTTIMNKLLLTIFFSFISIISLIAQQPEVEVTREKSRGQKGQYTFSAKNNTPQSKTVKVNFKILVNYQVVGGRNPFFKTISPGNNRLFNLKKANENGTSDFSYNTSSISGRLKYDLDENIHYAMPISQGHESDVSFMNFLRNKYGDEEVPEHWNAMTFSGSKGDTIRCSRKGVVIDLESSHVAERTEDQITFKRNTNYIKIEHEDGTIAEYDLFETNSTMVKIGDRVQVGDPLGTIGDYGFAKPNVQFVVYYYDLDNWVKNSGKSKIRYMPLNFWTKEHKGQLESKSSYTQDFHYDLISQEMNKKEKKKWKKANK